MNTPNNTVELTTKNTAALTMGIIAIVIGVLALLVGWVPFLGLLAIPAALIGLLMAFIGFILALTKRFKGFLMPLLGGIISAIALVVPILSTGGSSAAISRSIEDTTTRMADAREQREREELRDLLDRRATIEEYNRDFNVIGAQFFRERDSLGLSSPIIEIEVENSTGSSIGRAFFVGTLISEGRQIPWLKESFNYQISGGLEPGENATWRLAPNRYSEWGRVDPPEDAMLMVDVVGLEGPDGERLPGGLRFSSWDAERLDELLERYGYPGDEPVD